MTPEDQGHLEALRESINVAAAVVGCRPARLAIERWYEHKPEGYPSMRTVQRFGGWRALKLKLYGEAMSQGGRTVRAEEPGPEQTWDDETDPGHVPLMPVPKGHYVKGVSTLVGANGNTIAQWVKTNKEAEDREAVLARLLAELPERVPARVDCIDPPYLDPDANDLLAVYPWGDPHFGMLSWHEETGEDYDLRIAERLHIGAMRHLVTQSPRCRDALIINLGDALHADSEAGVTMRSGHALDVDSRYARVLRVVVRVMVAAIDLCLEHHHRVFVINERGNHDDHSALFLAIAMAEHYRNEPRVRVDLSPARWHKHRHGKVLIGVTHGHGRKARKPADLQAYMAAAWPGDWGATRHRVWHCGHVHHDQVTELDGCRVETHRTLAARDAHAAAEGYQSGRDMKRIVYSAEQGREVSRSRVDVAYLEAVERARA